MQFIYGLIEDLGDGSACVRWFRNPDIVEDIKEDEEYYQSSYGSLILQFPDGLNLEECGFSFNDTYFSKREGRYIENGYD